MNFNENLTYKTEEIEKIISGFLPKEENYQKTIMEAMTYGMQAGGKRIRPLLMLETYKMFQGTSENINFFLSAIEMIHTYSLIHDDLPAMDNDEYRRGRKTTHIVFGEAIGILAGDALLNYAFETASKAFRPIEGYTMEQRFLEMERTGRAFTVLAEKAGIYGMIGGQTVDIQAALADCKDDCEEDRIRFIYQLKTSALIESAMMIGAILAGATEEQVQAVEQAASKIGMAFQIQDDILDIISTDEVLGKPVHSDEKNEKMTLAVLLGLNRAKEEVKSLSESASEIIRELPFENDFLIQLIEYLVERKK